MSTKMIHSVHRISLLSLVSLALLACHQLPTATSTAKSQPAAKHYNILYVMSDDHTASAIGAYQSRLAKLDPTPNIDKLATQGTLFKNVFATNSICTPSRASVLTGQYSQTNGVLDLNGTIPTAKQHLARLMGQAGFETAMIGKWHLREEPGAFDYYKVLPEQGLYFDPILRDKNKGSWPNNEVTIKGHSSDVVTDISINWLKNRKSDKPFFLMHHFKAPHDMFEYAPRYEDYLKGVHIPEPSSMYAQPEFGSIATRGEEDSMLWEIGTSISKRNPRRNMGIHMDIDPELSDKAYTHQAYQEYLRRYLRTVKGVDDNMGRLINYLKESGQYDNTIIIYTSDQGMMLGEHDYIDKRWMYDESMRMPFIVRHLGKKDAPKVSDVVANNTDFAPFMLELAGQTAPSFMQGKSFAAVLDNLPLVDWRKGTYYRYWMHRAHHDVPAHFGLRTKRYKLIFFYGINYDINFQQTDKVYYGMDWSRKDGVIPAKTPTPVAWELYDLEKDPDELINRYHHPDYQNIVQELKIELANQRKILNETDENYPHIQRVITEHWHD
ncbi:sulfatase [Paraglaciecola aquimarina]|uniref:Sulfatase n=1 Tax=Paraglaciecola aquimarina TaxID=1235557 RepID=A0ABU3SZM7_9ALTE|nr:sulfatase [Paraglaciecola aquimarina]MDU0355446.1 sulfatase [Paraglaciecola aquimarina]